MNIELERARQHLLAMLAQWPEMVADFERLVREEERRKTVEACQGQLRVMADLAPTEHKSIYQLAIKQLRCLLPQQEDKNG